MLHSLFDFFVGMFAVLIAYVVAALFPVENTEVNILQERILILFLAVVFGLCTMLIGKHI